MMLVAQSGHLISMNAAARRLLGYSPQDIPSLDLEALGTQAISGRLGEFCQLGRAGVEGMVITKQGRRVQAQLSTAAMEDGSLQFMITALAEASPQGDAISEEAPVPFLDLSLGPEAPRIEWMNHSARELLGEGVGSSPAPLFGVDAKEFAVLLENAGDGGSLCKTLWTGTPGDNNRRAFKFCVRILRGATAAGDKGLISFTETTEDRRELELLTESLRRDSVLLRESQHRIKNSLSLIASMIAFQRSVIEDEECANSLLSTEARIQALAHFHDRLSHLDAETRTLELRSFLGDLVETIERAYLSIDRPIVIDSDIEALEIDTKRASTIGLIVNELVTNSLKYAFPGRPSGMVWIRSRLSEGQLTLSVGDDGIGLPEGFSWRKSTGLGFQFIDLLAQQLYADVLVAGEGGFSFSMAIPIALAS
jgi:two-component sensor histidine kinase